jgi:methionyl-tRNA formyltransferase
MKFAITAIDRYLGVFEAFVEAGWTPVKLFTVPAKCELDNHNAVVALAGEHGAAVQISKMMREDLADLKARGCDALIVASYDWPVPDWTPYLRYAVNFHSAPLPEARGPYPLMRAILEKRESWAVTCHRLASDIDAGEILAAEDFAMRADECHESLDLKVQMAAARLAKRIAADLPDLWARATPQGNGFYWRMPQLSERVIDFDAPVDDVLLHVRAYGATGSLANIGGAWFAVKRAVGWTERHEHTPGAVAHVHNRSIVVATPDGYVGLLEMEPVPATTVAELQAQLKLFDGRRPRAPFSRRRREKVSCEA